MGFHLKILIQGRGFLLFSYIEARVYIYVCFASKSYMYVMESLFLVALVIPYHIMNEIRA